MAVVVGLFSYAGFLLDEWLGVRPVFLLVGLAVGGRGGCLHVVSVTAPELLPFGAARRRNGSSKDAGNKGVRGSRDEEPEA